MRLRCRVSLEVRSLLSPALGTPTELREARAEGEERGRAGSHSPKQMERGGPLSAAAAPALSARLLQPSRGRASAGSPTVRIGLWPGPHRAAPAAAPPPAPPLPWPAAPTCCGRGRGGGIENPREPHRGPSIWDPNQEAASPEQPGSCTSCVEPGPGAAWPSRRAPALQGPCRSRSRSSLLQGRGSPQGPVPEEEMAGIGALSELR